MSQNEDYLDSLLRSVTSYKQELNKKSDISQELISREMDDFAEFDSEIGQMLGKSSPMDDDEFIREFEKELLNDKELFPGDKKKEYTPDSVNKNPEEEVGFFDKLNEIVHSEEPPKQQAEETPPEQEDLLEQNKEETPAAEDQDVQKEQEPDGIELPEGIIMPEMVGDGTGGSTGDAPEPELMDLLSSLSSEDENIGELNDLLKADEDNIDVGGILNDPAMEETPSESISEMLQKEIDTSSGGKENKKEKQEMKNKKKEKNGESAGGLKGFFQKLLNALGGSDEDDEEEQIVVPESQSLESISEENMEILRELESEGQAQEKGKKGGQKKEKKEKKEKKDKKEKKEKKEKAPKKEKAKKPPKPKKEKKEKKPKEKMPPVPKGPLVACLILGASIFALIYLFSNFQGNTQIEQSAENYFNKGDYSLAYEAIEGYTITEKNQELYDKIRLMAFIGQQRDAFYYFEQVGMHENALDALVRGVQRYETYVDEAASYGLGSQYAEIEQEIELRLKDTFLMSAEDAKNLYAIHDKTEYTNEVYKIVAGLGLNE